MRGRRGRGRGELVEVVHCGGVPGMDGAVLETGEDDVGEGLEENLEEGGRESE